MSAPPELLGPDDLVRRLERLPSSAEVLPKILDLLKDESASMESVSALISMDPGVAASVLQLSNSAYYSNGDRSYNIGEAVTRVGLLKAYELVANAVAGRLFLRDLATYGIAAAALWRSSFTCALAAEKLALRTGFEGPTAYTSGLFHLSGLMAIDLWSEEGGKGVRIASEGFPRETTEDEKRQLGFTHAAVAGALLRRWSFHSKIVEPIRWQHLPKNAGAYTKMACVLHVAKWLAAAAHLEPDAPAPPLPEESILTALRLPVGDLADLRMEVRADYDSAVNLLNNLGAEQS